jgi:Curli production assembly/transport component CsgG
MKILAKLALTDCKSVAILLAVLFSAPPAPAQFLERLRNPLVPVQLKHPPGLGLNIERVAFGPATGNCADMLVDEITERLIQGRIEVLNRQNVQEILREQRFSVSDSVDPTSALQLGKILGAKAFIYIKVQRCTADQQALVSGSFYVSKTRAFVRGSVQTVDLATGRTFVARAFNFEPFREKKSSEGQPEFPSKQELIDEALKMAAIEASHLFVPWVETRELYFFNDNECGLKQAHTFLKSGDLEGALKQSEQNLAACKSGQVAEKKNTLAHAYYNVGLLYMIQGRYQEALEHLNESRAGAGQIATDAILDCRRSELLAAEMKRVDERTAAVKPPPLVKPPR